MKVKYYFLKALFWLLSIVPFWFYHLLSSISSWFIIKTKGYRYKVVNNNLKIAFPDKSEDEIHRIVKDFYLHFTDLMIESLKAFSFSRKQIKKRFKINYNPDVQKLIDEGRSLAVVLPHYGNWEWSTHAFPIFAERNQPPAYGIYKPLSNKIMDQLIRDNRTKFGGTLIPKKTATKQLRYLIDKQLILGLAADQSPADVYSSYWMQFLGHETGVFFGPEKLSKQLDLVVVYAHNKKVKRSTYEITLEVITDDAKATGFGEITEKHMRLLEADIYKTPHLWLWTHKRWKRSKPADYEVMRRAGNTNNQ